MLSWKARIVITGLILVLAVGVGFFGGFLGPMLSLSISLPMIAAAGFLFLPWHTPAPAQEDLLQQLGKAQRIFGEMAERQASFAQLQEEIDEAGILGDKEMKAFRERMDSLKELPEKDAIALREILFARERRMRVLFVFVLALAALGGALLVIPFSRLL